MPKRHELIKYIKKNNAEFLRCAKGSHEIWIRGTGFRTTVQNDIELKNRACKRICNQLGIPSKW
jgi:hypothetical protein